MPQDPFRVLVASVPGGRYVIAAVSSEFGQIEPTVCGWWTGGVGDGHLSLPGSAGPAHPWGHASRSLEGCGFLP